MSEHLSASIEYSLPPTDQRDLDARLNEYVKNQEAKNEAARRVHKEIVEAGLSELSDNGRVA